MSSSLLHQRVSGPKLQDASQPSSCDWLLIAHGGLTVIEGQRSGDMDQGEPRCARDCMPRFSEVNGLKVSMALIGRLGLPAEMP